MILIKNTDDSLKFETLPIISNDNDNTTETCRARLYINVNNKIFKIDVLNIYIPPIYNKDKNDDRIQNFSSNETFNPVIQDYKANKSNGILIAGDINAHAWEWDASSSDDIIGDDIMNFLDSNEFVVANDSGPTYYSHISSNDTNEIEDKNEDENEEDNKVKGNTAPDVTFIIQIMI